jgi:hypothetical protein
MAKETKPAARKPQRKVVTHKAAAERLEVIRRQNVQRHHKAAATTKLREEILRHTANRNLNFELDRLHEASLRHSGLDAAGLNRLHDLKQKVIDK